METKTKRTTAIMVALNIVFSKPLLSKWPLLPSPPPKAPPTPASERCNKTRTIMATDKITWIKGNKLTIRFITASIPEIKN